MSNFIMPETHQPIILIIYSVYLLKKLVFFYVLRPLIDRAPRNDVTSLKLRKWPQT